MNKLEADNTPQQNPLFEQNELEMIENEDFRDFLTKLGEGVVSAKDEGLYDLYRTMQNMAGFFLPPSLQQSSNTARRQIFLMNELQDDSFFESQMHGARETRYVTVDKANLLMGFSYLYTLKNSREQKKRVNVVLSSRLKETGELWGEHPMASYINTLLGMSPDERYERSDKKKRKNARLRSSFVAMKAGEPIPVSKVEKMPPEELSGILSKVDAEYVRDKISWVDREIAKNPRACHRTEVEWNDQTVSEEVGATVEFIRRENYQIDTKVPINVVTFEDLRQGILLTLRYLETHEDTIPNLEVLYNKVRQTIQKRK